MMHYMIRKLASRSVKNNLEVLLNREASTGWMEVVADVVGLFSCH